jgi:hypothetical protein
MLAQFDVVGIKLPTIVVLAVPEGFPFVVTISLTYSMHWMVADSNFVRRLTTFDRETRTINQITFEYFIVKNGIFPPVTFLDDTSSGFRDQPVLSLRMNTTAMLTNDNLFIGWEIESALLRCLKETLHFNIHRIRQPAAITMCFPL